MLKEQRSVTELASEYGIHPTMLHRWRNQAAENLAQIFKDKDTAAEVKAQYERKIEELYTEIGRLTTQLAWMEKKVSCLTRTERLALFDVHDPELSVRAQTRLLQVNRSHLYYKPRSPLSEELALKQRIDEIYTEYPFYGYGRITAVLQREGFLVNRKAVQRYMQEMGIAGICPGPTSAAATSNTRSTHLSPWPAHHRSQPRVCLVK